VFAIDLTRTSDGLVRIRDRPVKLLLRRLLDLVYLFQNILGADLLGVLSHHWIDEFLHLVAILERDALQPASLLQRFKLSRVLN
jgi:hypothetical protein